MPKSATKLAPHMIQEAPANTTAPPAATAQEAATNDDGHGQNHEGEQGVRSPQQFYAELTKRPDVRAFLKRLADR